MASSSSKLSRMASDCSHGGSNYELSDFPIDIIFNILSGLPADTLARLRIVCKLWNKVITDPAFIDLHLSTDTAGATASTIPSTFTDISRSRYDDLLRTHRDHINYSLELSKNIDALVAALEDAHRQMDAFRNQYEEERRRREDCEKQLELAKKLWDEEASRMREYYENQHQ